MIGFPQKRSVFSVSFVLRENDMCFQYTPSVTDDWNLENGLTLRTPSHG